MHSGKSSAADVTSLTFMLSELQEPFTGQSTSKQTLPQSPHELLRRCATRGTSPLLALPALLLACNQESLAPRRRGSWRNVHLRRTQNRNDEDRSLASAASPSTHPSTRMRSTRFNSPANVDHDCYQGASSVLGSPFSNYLCTLLGTGKSSASCTGPVSLSPSFESWNRTPVEGLYTPPT